MFTKWEWDRQSQQSLIIMKSMGIVLKWRQKWKYGYCSPTRQVEGIHDEPPKVNKLHRRIGLNMFLYVKKSEESRSNHRILCASDLMQQ